MDGLTPNRIRIRFLCGLNTYLLHRSLGGLKGFRHVTEPHPLSRYARLQLRNLLRQSVAGGLS